MRPRKISIAVAWQMRGTFYDWSTC